jgi:hypothetical protein
MTDWMPKETYAGPSEDPLAKGIWDPPPGAIPIWGFLTRNPDDADQWRLFTDMSLTDYYDLAASDIRYSHQFGDEARGSVVYVDLDRELRHTTVPAYPDLPASSLVGTAEELLTSLTEGSISEEYPEARLPGGVTPYACTLAQRSKPAYPNCCPHGLVQAYDKEV